MYTGTLKLIKTPIKARKKKLAHHVNINIEFEEIII